MGWLDEVVDYVNQKGQGLGTTIYDYVNNPKNAEELNTILASLPVFAGTLDESARRVFPNEQISGIPYSKELAMNEAAKNMEGRFPTEPVRATPSGTRLFDSTAPTTNPIIERATRPSTEPRIIRGIQDNTFSVGGKPNPSAIRGTEVGTAGSTLLPSMAKAIPLGLALSELIRQIPGWDETMEKAGGNLYRLLHSKDTSKPLTEEEWRGTEEAKSMGYTGTASNMNNTQMPGYKLPSTEEYTPAGGKLSEYSMREGEGIEAYKQRLGTGNQGTPSEEIEKVWGKLNPETGKMEGGVSGLGDIVSNKKLFARETPIEPEKTTEEQRMTDAEKKMLSAKKAAINVLGYDPENLDPDREALGNTYRYFMGKYYTPQQYAQVYNYYYKEAMQKKKDGMTAVSHVMDKLMAETANVRSLEEIRKANLEQRKKEHEERMELRQKQAEEKRLAGHKENVTAIEKSINMLFAPYAKPDATTDVVDPNKIYYSITQDMQEAYREIKAKAERYNKSENLTPQEAAQKAYNEVFSTRTEDRVDRLRGFIQRRYPKYATMNDEGKADLVKKLKGWGYTDAEISRATGLSSTSTASKTPSNNAPAPKTQMSEQQLRELLNTSQYAHWPPEKKEEYIRTAKAQGKII